MSTSDRNNQQPALESGDRGILVNQTQQTYSNRLTRLLQHSKLLMALVEPSNFTLQYANDSFCRLIGTAAANLHNQGIRLCDLFLDFDEAAQERLYRRHVLALVLRDIYQLDCTHWRFLDEPTLVFLNSTLSPEPRCIQFWLRSEHLKVERIDPQLDEFADLKLSQLSAEELIPQPLWEERLQLDNYRIKGQLLWEGLDVTDQEIIRRLIGMLIENDSLLRSEKFRLFNEQMRSLFRADNILLLRVKRQEVKLFTCQEDQVMQTQEYGIESLKDSHFLRAARANRVWRVSKLETDCQTDFEKTLCNQGVRSLLVIPLIAATSEGDTSLKQLMGIVALTSKHPNNFDQLDVSNASGLIPALSSAVCQSAQGQFSHIHPSVEWRFLEEAERRSWGLPPEPIVFANVYPMYGISDIRGSSEERNRAIQRDLLAQFDLGVAVVDAVCQNREFPFLQQLRQDLLAYSERLRKGVMVDAEVTAVQYLRTSLEVYFDCFRECGAAAAEAVNAYEQACDNEHRCVYTARDRYDRMIHEINNVLRETWERWQARMQKVVPHYCDLELTDGMDHMLYAGASINSQFTLFHLHCLRYEQLRAICDCARSCFRLRDRFETPLQVTHLILIQDTTVDIFHDEQTDKLFDLRGSTRDTRYEIVKKRIDKAVESHAQVRITQPGMLTLVYSTPEELAEYQQYLRYLAREGWVDTQIHTSTVEPLQGITGLKFARVRILPAPEEAKEAATESAILISPVEELGNQQVSEGNGEGKS
ncbi:MULTISPECIES: GAF domain-containing protein [unclassified Coleofasciculus]|uniref:GAF domain-containing protein n=1 Tax=unclassified Coleofasciculus TaxID=2692782 RepID=UPI00187F6AEB|nr:MULTISPECIES: GAF domain-containing protein [unclassified Coleofasciculus]MBE9127183.1 GAF domain-containing protein [Coleofasciculus sp. LEGE 07081]MBE9150504.1 GAF domain-containing protein [Coleofasciculus sp. LEGE 07092]